MPLKTVLIVDDDSLFCWALQKELSFHGLDTRIAYTGQECLAAVREKRYDLLFLDIHLPDRNGIELLMTLRKISPDTRIVIVSWDGATQNKEAALSEGAEQFLEKPFDIGVVTRLLSSALRKDSCQRRHIRYFCAFPLRLSILEPAPEEAQFFLGSMRGTVEDVGADRDPAENGLSIADRPGRPPPDRRRARSVRKNDSRRGNRGSRLGRFQGQPVHRRAAVPHQTSSSRLSFSPDRPIFLLGAVTTAQETLHAMGPRDPASCPPIRDLSSHCGGLCHSGVVLPLRRGGRVHRMPHHARLG